MIVLSEYGIRDVSKPVHLNRVLREHGLIAVRDELGHEMLDPGASAAFAVADHQVAHVYVNDRIAARTRCAPSVERVPGVEAVLGEPEKRARARRSRARRRSDRRCRARTPGSPTTSGCDDRRAPDFARTVEIHRKPGYDPVELFLDPAIRIPPLTVGWKLMKRKAGFRIAARRHPARREPGERIARPADRMGRRRTGVHQRGKGSGRLDENHFSRRPRSDPAASGLAPTQQVQPRAASR